MVHTVSCIVFSLYKENVENNGRTYFECVTDLSGGWRGRVGLCQAVPELCAAGAGGVQEADR